MYVYFKNYIEVDELKWGIYQIDLHIVHIPVFRLKLKNRKCKLYTSPENTFISVVKRDISKELETVTFPRKYISCGT
jgi:hypothetical protein